MLWWGKELVRARGAAGKALAVGKSCWGCSFRRRLGNGCGYGESWNVLVEYGWQEKKGMKFSCPELELLQ